MMIKIFWVENGPVLLDSMKGQAIVSDNAHVLNSENRLHGHIFGFNRYY